MKAQIPEKVLAVSQVLQKNGHSAYLVGGCLRNLLLDLPPKDWDIATDAEPEEIQKLFPDSVYENEFGTVGVKVAKTGNPDKDIVEVTTFRKEGAYTDKRHPDSITFAKKIEDDLSRRDFTMNALALDLADVRKEMIVDPFDGKGDLKKGIVRAVGDPNERFNEDALRLMRAVRFAAELNFEIEPKTAEAVRRHAHLLEFIAKERIRVELEKILMSARAMQGIQMLEDYGLLKFILPELREGLGVGQNLHHIYSVWEHNLRALEYAAKKKYELVIRLAALLHDVGKPRTKRGEGKYSTFYGHDVVGARMVPALLDRLHFAKDVTEKVVHLVRHHLFYYNVGEVSPAGVRRFLARVGPGNVDDLLKIREADRIGSGVPKAVPYKTRHLLFMIEKVKRDPISPKMLAVNGGDVMAIARIAPSPKVGFILAILLEEVLDDPSRNGRKLLEARIRELCGEPETKLKKIASEAREKKEEFEAQAEAEIKKQFYVT